MSDASIHKLPQVHTGTYTCMYNLISLVLPHTTTNGKYWFNMTGIATNQPAKMNRVFAKNTADSVHQKQYENIMQYTGWYFQHGSGHL